MSEIASNADVTNLPDQRGLKGAADDQPPASPLEEVLMEDTPSEDSPEENLPPTLPEAFSAFVLEQSGVEIANMQPNQRRTVAHLALAFVREQSLADDPTMAPIDQRRVERSLDYYYDLLPDGKVDDTITERRVRYLKSYLFLVRSYSLIHDHAEVQQALELQHTLLEDSYGRAAAAVSELLAAYGHRFAGTQHIPTPNPETFA